MYEPVTNAWTRAITWLMCGHCHACDTLLTTTTILAIAIDTLRRHMLIDTTNELSIYDDKWLIVIKQVCWQAKDSVQFAEYIWSVEIQFKAQGHQRTKQLKWEQLTSIYMRSIGVWLQAQEHRTGQLRLWSNWHECFERTTTIREQDYGIVRMGAQDFRNERTKEQPLKNKIMGQLTRIFKGKIDQEQDQEIVKVWT